MKVNNWKILNKLKAKNSKLKTESIVDVLLENRGLKTEKEKKEFFNPKHPNEIKLKELGIGDKLVTHVLKRLEAALVKKEKVIIYGDYDADGICATAILWETLHHLGFDATPYIPDRFTEGYGINAESIQKLKTQNSKLKLIITVDNGIVANEAIDKANELEIDVIVTDHHEKGKLVPSAYCLLHTTKICGSAIAWFLSREINKSFNNQQSIINNLELAAIGTVADIIHLIGINRSLVKHGLDALTKTRRPGLIEIKKETGLVDKKLGTYEIGYIIAPRINAMGRLASAMDSLRLLCTTSESRAKELGKLVSETNRERQNIVTKSFLHAENILHGSTLRNAIIISHEEYHEGVIGLAAAEIVKKYYRPAIVISQGKEVSKASARSIPGFNIIEAIHKFDHLILGGGGHPMAAGFSIESKNISNFINAFTDLADKEIKDELLNKIHYADCVINFDHMTKDLIESLKDFEPFGAKNYEPVFVSKDVSIVDVTKVGQEGKHLKLVLKQNQKVFDAIGFGMGSLFQTLNRDIEVDILYSISENVWNGNTSIQLTLKDLDWKK